jgi:hypothetical protein
MATKKKNSPCRKENMKIRWKKETWFDKVAVGFGLLVLSPFILAELVIMGFQWLIKKIKRK